MDLIGGFAWEFEGGRGGAGATVLPEAEEVGADAEEEDDG